MVFADLTGDTITVKTEYRDKDLIRTVPGATYKPNNHQWEIPLSWAACITLRGVFRERLEIGEGLNSWAGTYIRDYVSKAMQLRDATDGEGDPDLYPFQRAGTQFLAHARHAVLMDEMGTGKTVQSIRTMVKVLRDVQLNPFPALIICPNGMKKTWQKEFARWWPGVKVVVLEGGRVQRNKQIAMVRDGEAHVLVANWESLRMHSKLGAYGSIRLKRCVDCDTGLRADVATSEKDRDAAKAKAEANPADDDARAAYEVAEAEYKKLERSHSRRSCERCPREMNEIPWTTIVADEAHRAKDPKAKQTRALWALRTDETKLRYALTGTPIADAPQDLWCALHFIDPKGWPTRTKYIDRWCLQSYNPFGGMTVIGLKPETRDEFFKIVDPFTRRMPKSLVLAHLPKKIYQTRYLEMTPKQKKAYDQMKLEMVTQLADAGGGDRLVALNPLTQLTRLTQLASSYGELVTTYEKDPNTGMMVPRIDVQLTDPSNKIDELMDFEEDMRGKAFGVFAQSRQLIMLASARLEKRKIKHGLIVGGQTQDERQATIDRFQGGEYDVVLATVGAGGVGITLTRGGSCVFMQRSWSMIENTQAEDRFHRIGSEIHESINIIDFVSQGTIEEGQRLALEAKGDRAQEILRDADLLKKLIQEGTI